VSKRKIPKVIYVVWKDACSWHDDNIDVGRFNDKATRSAMQESSGIMLKDDAEGVVIAQSRRPGEVFIDGPLCIPREYIKYKKYLK